MAIQDWLSNDPDKDEEYVSRKDVKEFIQYNNQSVVAGVDMADSYRRAKRKYGKERFETAYKKYQALAQRDPNLYQSIMNRIYQEGGGSWEKLGETMVEEAEGLDRTTELKEKGIEPTKYREKDGKLKDLKDIPVGEEWDKVKEVMTEQEKEELGVD